MLMERLLKQILMKYDDFDVEQNTDLYFSSHQINRANLMNNLMQVVLYTAAEKKIKEHRREKIEDCYITSEDCNQYGEFDLYRGLIYYYHFLCVENCQNRIAFDPCRIQSYFSFGDTTNVDLPYKHDKIFAEMEEPKCLLDHRDTYQSIDLIPMYKLFFNPNVTEQDFLKVLKKKSIITKFFKPIVQKAYEKLIWYV